MGAAPGAVLHAAVCWHRNSPAWRRRLQHWAGAYPHLPSAYPRLLRWIAAGRWLWPTGGWVGALVRPRVIRRLISSLQYRTVGGRAPRTTPPLAQHQGRLLIQGQTAGALPGIAPLLRGCLALEGQRGVIVGRRHARSTPAIQQDEVVEHNLDARMAFARHGIVPAQGMEPACHVHTTALGHILGADLGQRTPGDAATPLGGLLAWPSASFQR